MWEPQKLHILLNIHEKHCKLSVTWGPEKPTAGYGINPDLLEG